MNPLETVSRAITNGLIFIISKIIICFWTLYRRVFGYPRMRTQRPTDTDLARYEQKSVPLGVIRLFRHDTPDEAFIFGHCLNENWDVIIKGVLHEKKASGKNEFYLYTDHPENEMIQATRSPAPITVSFLDNILGSKKDE